jgi:hypothetical protein
MNDSVFFATFDPLFCDTPELCPLCGSHPPIFNYEFTTRDPNGERQYVKGFCCGSCAPALVRKLERTESREWAEEEAALEADDMDISEFHKRRLAAFAAGAKVRKTEKEIPELLAAGSKKS